MLKKIVKTKNFWPVVVITILALLASRRLFVPGYFIMHDDLQMMRTLEMEKCFKDFQIPCRWVPDMGYGFGFPLFNFYPPLPYLFAMVFRLLAFPFTATVKLTFASAFLLSGAAMYFFARKFFLPAGRQAANIGGVVAGIFYIWAPYHAVDIYVRGAMNEAWAFVFFPLILLFSYQLITSHKNLILLSLSWVGLLLAHNLMVLIFTPVFALWCLLWIVKSKKILSIKYLVLSGILTFGLAAFFTLPVLVESKLVYVNLLTQGYYDFAGHFATLRQLFISRFWGDGPSTFGIGDGMAFPIGHIHWIAVAVSGLVFVYFWWKRKKLEVADFVFVFFMAVGLFSAFMAHGRSTPIWLAIPVLKYVQFPWRFLTLASLGFSFAAGWLICKLEKFKKQPLWLVIIMVIAVVVWNWEFFAPVREGPVTDTEKFAGEAWRIQQAAGIYDYLPNTAKIAPDSKRTVLAEIIEGKGIIYFENHPERTNWLTFDADIKEGGAVVRINVLAFPDWKVLIDGNQVPTYIDEVEEWGRLYVDIPEGKHFVYARLYNTPIRNIANGISLVTWLGFLSFPLVKKFRRQ